MPATTWHLSSRAERITRTRWSRAATPAAVNGTGASISNWHGSAPALVTVRGDCRGRVSPPVSLRHVAGTTPFRSATRPTRCRTSARQGGIIMMHHILYVTRVYYPRPGMYMMHGYASYFLLPSQYAASRSAGHFPAVFLSLGAALRVPGKAEEGKAS